MLSIPKVCKNSFVVPNKMGLPGASLSRPTSAMKDVYKRQIVNGTTYSFASQSTVFTVNSGQGIRLSSASNPSIMTQLTQVNGTVNITDISTLTADGKEYAISPEVQVYEKEYSGSTIYRLKPISEIVGTQSHTLYAYYDRLPSVGGRIRIIIAVSYTHLDVYKRQTANSAHR